jgi:hypothetical protein
VTRRAGGTPAGPPAIDADQGATHQPPHPQSARQQLTAAARQDPASHRASPALEDTTASPATRAVAVSAPGREARTTTEPPDLDPPDREHPDSEWPEWPDPAVPGGEWPSFTINGRHAAYVIALAVSPWFKDRYPDRSANLRDALHAGRDPRLAPEPGRQADREAGE